jgi:pyruvate,orthophosphate dikinase
VDIDDALDAADAGEDVILVRTSTSPDDVAGMMASRAIVTELGGTTSHAAVVSRELGCPAVVGCGAGVAAALDGKVITVDGGEGEVREGALELTAWSEHDSPDLVALATLARTVTPLRAYATGTHPVLTDADTATVRDALERGQTDVVCDRPLIAMLTAIQLTEHHRRSDDG